MSNVKKSLRVTAITGFAAMAAFAAASPAVAATVDTWSDNREARATSNDSWVRAYDEEANGESAYAIYNLPGEHDGNTHRVEVFSGAGTYEQSADHGEIDWFKACANNNFPDDCGNAVWPHF
ncbi:hypothetical protein [Haloglycomyces albus]|uniref:hypothetical protein n=1 Tax=Haloglycomyces albus TaxID=526067 RepID=UPI0012EB50E9|nr:hypothetical protein [Haloglycomyces albus]